MSRTRRAVPVLVILALAAGAFARGEDPFDLSDEVSLVDGVPEVRAGADDPAAEGPDRVAHDAVLPEPEVPARGAPELTVPALDDSLILALVSSSDLAPFVDEAMVVDLLEGTLSLGDAIDEVSRRVHAEVLGDETPSVDELDATAELVTVQLLARHAPAHLVVATVADLDCGSILPDCVDDAEAMLVGSSLVRQTVAAAGFDSLEAWVHAQPSEIGAVSDLVFSVRSERWFTQMADPDWEPRNGPSEVWQGHLTASAAVARLSLHAPPWVWDKLASLQPPASVEEGENNLGALTQVIVAPPAVCSEGADLELPTGMFGSCGLASEIPNDDLGPDIDPSPEMGAPPSPPTPMGADTWLVNETCRNLDPKHFFGSGTGAGDEGTAGEGTDEETEAQAAQKEALDSARKASKTLEKIDSIPGVDLPPPLKALKEALDKIIEAAEALDGAFDANMKRTDDAIDALSPYKPIGGAGFEAPWAMDEVTQGCGATVAEALLGCMFDLGNGEPGEVGMLMECDGLIGPGGQGGAMDPILFPDSDEAGSPTCTCVPNESGGVAPAGSSVACVNDCMEACIPESGPACSEAELGACTAQCPSDLYEELCLGDAPSPAFVTLCGAFDPSPIDDPEADPEEPPCTDPDGCDDDACDPTVDPDCFPAPPSPVP